MDAEGRDLLRERSGESLDRELAGTVEGNPGQCAQPGHGGNRDDVPAAPLPHVGQDGLDRRDRSEYVDVELASQVAHVGLLDGAFESVTGVGDQHIDRRDRGLNLVDCGDHARVIGDVE